MTNNPYNDPNFQPLHDETQKLPYTGYQDPYTSYDPHQQYWQQSQQYNPATMQYPGMMPTNTGNWPSWLVDASAQRLYSFAALIIGFFSVGIIGFFMSIYYLFVLDKTVPKDGLSKVLNWISFIIPLIGIVLIVIALILFMVVGVSAISLSDGAAQIADGMSYSV